MPFGMSNRFIDRLRERFKHLWEGESPDARDTHVDPKLQGPATGIDLIMYRIRYAARNRMLLWMKYHGEEARKQGRGPSWRHVEPYSFRARANPGPQPLFYGWCELHDEIHSFRIDNIIDVHVTDRPFAPRFPIEIS